MSSMTSMDHLKYLHIYIDILTWREMGCVKFTLLKACYSNPRTISSHGTAAVIDDDTKVNERSFLSVKYNLLLT